MAVKYWEIIADNLKKAGWSLDWVSAVDSQGEQSGLLTHIKVTDTVSLCADEILTLFLDSNLRFAREGS
jgi:hypothetical protein